MSDVIQLIINYKKDKSHENMLLILNYYERSIKITSRRMLFEYNKTVYPYYGILTLDDFISEGKISLMKAIEKFNIKKYPVNCHAYLNSNIKYALITLMIKNTPCYFDAPKKRRVILNRVDMDETYLISADYIQQIENHDFIQAALLKLNEKELECICGLYGILHPIKKVFCAKPNTKNRLARKAMKKLKAFYKSSVMR
jgi:hypothetical protein